MFYESTPSSTYSRISPGWQPRDRHMASRVLNRMALALPVFRIEIFAMVIPTLSDNSVTLIFRFASITSKLIMIPICLPLHGQTAFHLIPIKLLSILCIYLSDDPLEAAHRYKYDAAPMDSSHTVRSFSSFNRSAFMISSCRIPANREIMTDARMMRIPISPIPGFISTRLMRMNPPVTYSPATASA